MLLELIGQYFVEALLFLLGPLSDHPTGVNFRPRGSLGLPQIRYQIQGPLHRQFAVQCLVV